MTDRDRLIELLKEILPTRGNASGIPIIQKWDYGATADKLLTNGVILPPCKVGDEVWVIDREDGEAVDISCVMFLAKSKGCIIATLWINDYDPDEILEYHINETQNNFDTDLKVYPDEDCFATKEEAEAELRKRSDNNA